VTARFVRRVVRGVDVVDVRGEVDIANVDSLEALLEVVADRSAAFVVSLAEATYFDSRTLHLIAQTIERANVTRRRVYFVVPSDRGARRLLQLSGIDTLMRIYESESAALAAAEAAS
jgi:anti-anti-sigma factor